MQGLMVVLKFDIMLINIWYYDDTGISIILINDKVLLLIYLYYGIVYLLRHCAYYGITLTTVFCTCYGILLRYFILT
jgi:hypothetical protein